jgi:hypothetical protein
MEMYYDATIFQNLSTWFHCGGMVWEEEDEVTDALISSK